jgi:hypothetical protein
LFDVVGETVDVSSHEGSFDVESRVLREILPQPWRKADSSR